MLTLPMFYLARSVTLYTCCPTLFQRQLLSLLYPNYDYELLRLPDLDNKLEPGVTCTGQQGMLTPPRNIISHLWYIQGSMFAMHTFLYDFFGLRD